MKNEYDILKEELRSHIVYFQFISSLIPMEKGGLSKENKEFIVNTFDFINKFKSESIDEGRILLDNLKEKCLDLQKICPLKVSLETAAIKFSEKMHENKQLFSFGLEYGFLQELIDCSNLGYPEYLPYHAKIGIGGHAGRGSIEEEFLLKDAFFLLIKAEKAYETLHKYGEYYKKNNLLLPDKKQLSELTVLNQNVATYSRLCLVSFFSFVEAFVNSIGYDYLQRNKEKLTDEQIKTLSGKNKNGYYLSLEDKIKQYPKIIVPSNPISTKNLALLKNELKEIRDSAMHYSPLKEAIWRKPKNWLDKTKKVSELSISFSLEFWKTCYSDQKEPSYLSNLDYEELIKLAKKRYELSENAIILTS